MNPLAHIEKAIHKSDHFVKRCLIIRPDAFIKRRYDQIVIKWEIDACRGLASLVVVRYGFQLFLAGIGVIRVDHLD